MNPPPCGAGLIAGIIVTYSLAGLFGIASRLATLLALAGMIVALDAFGPGHDNAGGIAEMAGLVQEVRHNTDALDAVGNTTMAVTKGLCHRFGGLGALVLFAGPIPRSQALFHQYRGQLRLANPYVVVGLLFGGLLPFLFGACR